MGRRTGILEPEIELTMDQKKLEALKDLGSIVSGPTVAYSSRSDESDRSWEVYRVSSVDPYYLKVWYRRDSYGHKDELPDGLEWVTGTEKTVLTFE